MSRFVLRGEPGGGGSSPASVGGASGSSRSRGKSGYRPHFVLASAAGGAAAVADYSDCVVPAGDAEVRVRRTGDRAFESVGELAAGGNTGDDGEVRFVEASSLELPPAPASLPLEPVVSQVDQDQIRKDLPRTFPEQPAVRRCVAQVEAMLREYAASDPDLGYCQGMNCLAAVVVDRLGSDWAEARRRFSGFVASLRGLWLAGFPLLFLGAAAFEVLRDTHLPELKSYFGKREMTLDMLATGILAGEWLSLFARWLPFGELWHAFEFVEAEGLSGMLGLTVAVLQAHMPALVEASDFMALFVLLKDLRCQPRQPELPHLLLAAQELLPAARRALEQAGGPDGAGSRPLLSVQRSGSRVVHAGSDLEVVVLPEDAGFSLQHLAKGLHTFCETVYGTVNDTFANSRSSLSGTSMARVKLRALPSRLPLCGCGRMRVDDD